MLSALARIPRTVGHSSIDTLRLAVKGAIELHAICPSDYPNPLEFDVNLGQRPPYIIHQCFCYDGHIRYYHANPLDEEGSTMSIQLDMYDAQVWPTPPSSIPR